jgi:hypothetical protein
MVNNTKTYIFSQGSLVRVFYITINQNPTDIAGCDRGDRQADLTYFLFLPHTKNASAQK